MMGLRAAISRGVRDAFRALGGISAVIGILFVAPVAAALYWLFGEIAGAGPTWSGVIYTAVAFPLVFIALFLIHAAVAPLRIEREAHARTRQSLRECEARLAAAAVPIVRLRPVHDIDIWFDPQAYPPLRVYFGEVDRTGPGQGVILPFVLSNAGPGAIRALTIDWRFDGDPQQLLRSSSLVNGGDYQLEEGRLSLNSTDGRQTQTVFYDFARSSRWAADLVSHPEAPRGDDRVDLSPGADLLHSIYFMALCEAARLWPDRAESIPEIVASGRIELPPQVELPSLDATVSYRDEAGREHSEDFSFPMFVTASTPPRAVGKEGRLEWFGAFAQLSFRPMGEIAQVVSAFS